jgi:ubiquinone/menaquinone biosynthesis C-methylase UbiE
MSEEAWKKANVDESAYWEIFTCEVETLKHQDIYMQALGITQDYYYEPDRSLNMSGLNVLDVGGGPASILLRTNNNLPNRPHDGLNKGVVIDPVMITDHQKMRYDFHDIEFIEDQAENIDKYYSEKGFFDECFIYNCLQHVVDPLKILDKITAVSKRIRIAEPLNVPTDHMHLHMFTENYFDEYFSQDRFTCHDKTITAIGSCNHYVGLFHID